MQSVETTLFREPWPFCVAFQLSMLQTFKFLNSTNGIQDFKRVVMGSEGVRQHH